MRQTFAILLICFIVTSGRTQAFDEFLARVAAAPDSEKPAFVDSFMNAAPQFPLVESDTLLYFIFRGNASSVTVLGDFNDWDSSACPMTRITGTDLWYCSEVFESDARLDYQFVLNGSYWILDPLNPNKVEGGYGANSELRMPAYAPAPEIDYYSDIPHGIITDTLFYNAGLGNSRTMKVYLPPGYSTSADSFCVILFHDGLDFLSLGKANNILDYLIAHKEIQPVIGVFIPAVDRPREYAGDLIPLYISLVVDEIMPWVEQKYRVKTNAQMHATLGVSNGGNIALWLGVTHPEVFGNVAALSSNVQHSIPGILQNGPMLNLRFYLDIGTYDIPELIPLVQDLRRILQYHGYVYQYREYHEGHSWGNWRAHVDNALEMFFPYSKRN